MAKRGSGTKGKPTSTLKVSDLKSLCLDNDLKISGTKSELLERLLSSGLSAKELGIKQDNIVDEKEEVVKDAEIIEEVQDIVEDDDGDLILESESTENNSEPHSSDDGDALDAEIIEADIVEDEPLIGDEEEELIEPAKVNKFRTESELSILSQFKQPKIITSLLVCLLLLGAGSWYIYNQPKPFTPDQLRYGDEMSFMVTDGALETSGEDLVTYLAKMLGAENDMCGKFNVKFSGTGNTKIFQGGADDISGEPNQNLLGTVRQTGPYGEQWLTVQKQLNYNLNDVDIETNTFAANNKCSSLLPYFALDNHMTIDTTIWNEAQDRSALKTSTDYTFNGAALGDGEGSIVTYGLSGLGGMLTSIVPGLDLIYSPVVLHEFLDGSLIQQGSSGETGYWNWEVAGEDEVAGEKAWKIFVENDYVIEKCIGHARATLWATDESPWPIKQVVDVQISTLEEDRATCDKSLLELGLKALDPDFEMPQGSISLTMQLLSSELISGTKLIQWSSYNQRPFIGGGGLSAVYGWDNRSHIPDLSQFRSHTLEKTVDCLTESQSSSSIVNAILSNGYIWKAQDNRSTEQTAWNLSWVDAIESGWVIVRVSTTESGETNCVITGQGLYELEKAPEYNKENIPYIPSLSSLENRALDSNLFPELSGTSSGLIGDENGIYPDSLVGYTIVTPSGEVDSILEWFERDDGAVTFELNRGWSENGNDNNLGIMMDGTDGRLLGWVYTSL